MSRRVALVIGNQDYDYANKLYWPEKDALDMARLFEDLGFNEGRVFPYRNQDNGSFRKLVDEFAASLRKGDLAAFYFSGHGVQDVNGDNFLLPTDAKFYTPQELAERCYPVNGLLSAIAKAECTGILFLDACRKDPFSGLAEGQRVKSVINFRKGLGEVARVKARDTLISYAAAPGEVAWDGTTEERSHYTAALLKHLPKPGASVGELLIDVRNETETKSNRKQLPWDVNTLLKPVVLVPGSSPPAPPPPPDKRWRLFQIRVSVGALVFRASIGMLVPAAAFSLFIFWLITELDPTAVVVPACDTSTPVSALACRVPDLAHPSDAEIRTGTAREIELALAGDSFSLPEKVLVVDALLDLAKSDRLRSLTPSGRFNVLARLADIPSDLWLNPFMLNTLETAHQVIQGIDAAHLANPFLGSETSRNLKTWKSATGFVPRDQIKVYPHYSGFSRDEFQQVMTALDLGWGWRTLPIDAKPAKGTAEVRYGNNSMKAAATLMAAQLNRKVAPRNTSEIPWDKSTVNRVLEEAKIPQVRAVLVPIIQGTNLEIWIGK